MKIFFLTLLVSTMRLRKTKAGDKPAFKNTSCFSGAPSRNTCTPFLQNQSQILGKEQDITSSSSTA